jgi:hypothetical protein
MTTCVTAHGSTCIICGQLVNNMLSQPSTPHRPYPDVYLPTPQSLPRALGTQFTPGVGETTVIEDKEAIPFQDLSKLAKRMEWAVVKMTNVRP